MRRITLVLLAAGIAWGQVPLDYQDLYSSLQQKLTAFDASVLSQWNGTKSNVDFSAELLSANCNRGLQLLTARQGYLAELAKLKALGVNTVTVCASFPILYQPFYQFNGDPADYQNMLAFYQQLATDVRTQGMKLAVESDAMFPGVYSTGSGFNLTGYYGTLGQQAYIDGRTQTIVTIAKTMQPDYLEMGSEPDTESQLTGQSLVNTPAGWGSLIGAFQTALNQQGLQNVRTAAGVGTWLSNAADYLRAINTSAPGLWYFDFHVYPVNLDFAQSTESLLELAVELGKPPMILEAWLLKERDSEFSTSNVASNPSIFSRDAFSFWAPLDQQFLSTMVKLAHWQQLKVFSAFWSRYFFAYLDYNQVVGQGPAPSPATIISQSEQAASAAIASGQYTSTATAYQALIAGGAFSPAAVVSDASYALGYSAPESVVAIFGTNLAPDAMPAPGTPPTTLDGVTVTVTDSTGHQAPASLYYVSPGQINAILPAGLAAGNGTLLITGPKGATSVGPIKVLAVAPALFSANASGEGPAAAVLTRVKPDGTQTNGLTFKCGSAAGSCVNVPIDVSNPAETVVISLYGTGIRNASGTLVVSVKINGGTLPVLSSGAQGQYPGLDQVNVQVPSKFAGMGEQAIQLTVNGQVAGGLTANPVTINLQ
ncbi:MAG TPA: hypothetical protein VGN17_15825 [Bryobacteraceae bacterium]|jgi:uncharacterized protein (TIGR03437 family)